MVKLNTGTIWSLFLNTYKLSICYYNYNDFLMLSRNWYYCESWIGHPINAILEQSVKIKTNLDNFDLIWTSLIPSRQFLSYQSIFDAR